MRALHLAISTASVPVVQVLLDYGALVHLPDENGDLPLHCCSTLDPSQHKEATQIAKLLVERGARINGRDRRRKTALQRAAEAGNVRMVEFLAEMGADVNIL